MYSCLSTRARVCDEASFEHFCAPTPPSQLIGATVKMELPSIEQHLLQTIHRHLSLENPASTQGIFSQRQISVNLLLALSSFLGSNSPFSPARILPQILSRFRRWRVLPRDERLSLPVLREIATDLAGLAASPDPPHSRKMQIVAIGSEAPRPLAPVNDHLPGVRAATSRTRSPSVPTSHHEMAAFRSGCSSCRMPRDTATPHSRHHLSCAHHDAENIPPPVSASDAKLLTRTHEPRPSHPNSKPEPQRARAHTIATGPPSKPLLPRRNTYTPSAKPLSSLSKPAVSVSSRAVSPLASTSVVSHPPNKPRPWPMPDAAMQPSKPKPTTSTSRPRVALGRHNALGS